MLKIVIPHSIAFSYLLLYFAFFIDSYRNPNKISERIFFDPVWLLSLLLLINFLIVYKDKVKIPKLFLRFNNFIILPVTLSVSTFFSIWTSLNPPNIVYSEFPINYGKLFILSIGSAAILFLNLPKQYLKRYYKIFIFLLPLVILFIGWIIRLWPNDVLLEITKEDHLIENVQFIFLIFSTVFSIALSNLFFKAKFKFMGLIYLFFALGIFIIAGEEISWGQRIFHLQTPDYLKEINYQNETNIHNINPLKNLIHYFYLALGFYGAVAWTTTFNKGIRKLKFQRYFIVFWYLSLFYLPIFIYNFFENPNMKHSFGEWSEIVEMLLYLGIMLFIFINFRGLRSRGFLI